MCSEPAGNATVAVTASVPELNGQAAALAQRLGLPLADHAVAGYAFLLTLTPQQLELRQQSRYGPGPVYVDFAGGKATHRRRSGGGRDQAIARAVGLKHGKCPGVLDVTAGLGKDAFVLAALGCHVRMLERSSVIAELLRDGLQRAAHDPQIGGWVTERLELLATDSLVFLEQLTDDARPDVIYLDPMYPERSKSALVKKDMRLLRALAGDDSDAPQLLMACLKAARARVVVKRPRLAPALAGPPPDVGLVLKATRFDIYLSKQKSNTADRQSAESESLR